MARAGTVRRSAPSPTPRRLRGAARRATIIAAAAELFAGQGFGASTRDIAASLSLSQALLYRYFPSKAALVDAVLAGALVDRWQPEWTDWLADATTPVAERLSRFYRAYAGSASPLRLRLWMQANLAGMDVSRRYSFPLTERILKPIAMALRTEAGLPSFEERPMTRGERELAMALHGGVVFLNIRRHVYRTPLPEDIDDLITLHVATFVAGALPVLRRMLTEPGAETLTVRLLR